jgi:hypothetical protein
MPEPRATSSTLLLLRLLAAGAALATAIAIVFAVGAISVAKAHGIALVDVLTAPIAFVVYAGPPLLALGMAVRARTGSAITIALVLAGLFAGGLEVLGGTPWHSHSWREHASDAQTRLLLGTLFAAWPLTIVGRALWLAANREED